MSRIALIGENSIEYIKMLLEIWDAGHCAVLLDWRIPKDTAIKMMKDADVKKCYIDENVVWQDNILNSSGIEYTTFTGTGKTVSYLPVVVYQKFRENYSQKEAIVLYSSGSTGEAKGIILSHYSINTNADAIIDYMKPQETDCIYIAKTLSHSSTLVGELLVALKTKTKLVIAPTIVPPRYVMSNISKYHISIICINPTLLAMFIEECNRGSYDITSLRNIYVSGSVLSDSVYKEARETFNGIHICNMYGLSEAAPRVTAQRNNSVSNSVGTPIRGVEIVIVDEQGRLAGTDTRGIIHVKTPSLFQGYISGKEKLTSLYKDWLNTGDIGWLDERGELHVDGRIDDVIIMDAHKIYPADVEKAIVHVAHISECSVVKVKRRDKEFIGCLYVSEQSMDDNIRKLLKNILLPYEIPRCFQRCDMLPRTLNGKISKHEVARILMEGIEKR